MVAISPLSGDNDLSCTHLGSAMRVLVTGGRKYQDRRMLFEVLDYCSAKNDEITLVIEGGASGADTLAREWGQARYVPVLTMFADWQKYGKAAGPIRNGEMLEKAKPDLVIAFPGGVGTENMIKQSHEAGIEVFMGDTDMPSSG